MVSLLESVNWRAALPVCPTSSLRVKFTILLLTCIQSLWSSLTCEFTHPIHFTMDHNWHWHFAEKVQLLVYIFSLNLILKTKGQELNFKSALLAICLRMLFTTFLRNFLSFWLIIYILPLLLLLRGPLLHDISHDNLLIPLIKAHLFVLLASAEWMNEWLSVLLTVRLNWWRLSSLMWLGVAWNYPT